MAHTAYITIQVAAHDSMADDPLLAADTGDEGRGEQVLARPDLWLFEATPINDVVVARLWS